MIKKIHCIGIGGIGVSAIARLYLAMGVKVSGSDVRNSGVVEELKTLGMEIAIGHEEKNITPDVELVVHSEDVNETSPGFVELKRAQDLNIKTQTYSKALGGLMAGKRGVGVSGTNGKSTTTAILGLIAEKAGIDPTVVVGSKIPVLSGSTFQSNVRVGASDVFIVEADEYHRHMLDASPWGVVLTNITADHLDYYADLEDIKSAFRDYISALPEDGVLVYNFDDLTVRGLASEANLEKLSFGMTPMSDLYPGVVEVKNGRQVFDLYYLGQLLGEFELMVPGVHNLLNAMGATLMALTLGATPEQIQNSLREFPGIWRRFEKIGEYKGKTIISDYAHHPDGIEKTLQAVKQFYPSAKVLTVFQPHQKNRTSKLYSQFVEALKGCDGLIVTEIFSVVGREKVDIEITSRTLVDDLRNSVNDIAFAADLNEAEREIMEKADKYDLIIFMGAGDLDNLARKLVK